MKLLHSNITTTLNTANKQCKEDITVYLNEPALSPENIKYGHSIAGVEGNYFDTCVINVVIWPNHTPTDAGYHVCQLATISAEATLTITPNRIILTNPPFVSQIIDFESDIFTKNREGWGFWLWGPGDGKSFPLNTAVPVSEIKDYLLSVNGSDFDVSKINVYAYASDIFNNLQITGQITGLSTTQPEARPWYLEVPKPNEFFDYEDIDLGEGSKMHVNAYPTETDFETYCNLLKETGFIKVSSKSMGDSTFTIFQTHSQTLTVQRLGLHGFYTHGDPCIYRPKYQIKVIEDSRLDIFGRTAFDNSGFIDPSFKRDVYQNLGYGSVILASDNKGSHSSYFSSDPNVRQWAGRMGFIYQLADGSFFIIDGGMGANHEKLSVYMSQAYYIMDILEKYAPDPSNIKIAGWLLTHMHYDHIGAFCDIAKTQGYRDKVHVEKIIYNISPNSLSDYQDSLGDNMRYNENLFKEALAFYPDSVKVKAHAGQKLYFRDLTLHIDAAIDTLLYAPDFDTANCPSQSYISQYLGGCSHDIKYTNGRLVQNCNDSNSTCIVSRVEFRGKSTLFLADAHVDLLHKGVIPLYINRTDTEVQYTALKADGPYCQLVDFVQVAHHGYSDTKAAILYSALASNGKLSKVFWPINMDQFSGYTPDGERYYESQGQYWSALWASDHNKALKDYEHIYPIDNKTMVCQDFENWIFEPVDTTV